MNFQIDQSLSAKLANRLRPGHVDSTLYACPSPIRVLIKAGMGN